MKKKIVFVVPNKSRTRGIRARCTHTEKSTRASCRKPQGHAGHHAYREAPSTLAARVAPKKYTMVSRATKLDCLAMIEDPAYRRKLLQDLRKRKLRPAVECMLWYYAKGKPKEMVEHSGTLSLQQELSALTPEQLRARALDIAKSLTPTVH